MAEEKFAFTKMQAFGNDFAIFDFRNEHTDKQLSINDLIILTDRNYGIGCDQFITIHKAQQPDDEKGTNVSIKVYNQDGMESNYCANGVRCVVGYIAKENQKPIVRVQIGNKILLGKPDRQAMFAKINVGIPVVNGDIVDLGTQHKINIVENFDNINKLPDEQYDIHYVQIRSRNEIFVRSIVKGAGELLSSGDGSCACAAYCITNNLTEKNMKVTNRGSDIMDTSEDITWDGAGKPMLFGGNYAFVFTGEIEL